MAKLQTKNYYVERITNGVKNIISKKICCCSECNGTIYTPANDNTVYYFCYNCGAKFDIPVTDVLCAKTKKQNKGEIKK